jgi:hypothetical protein
VYFRVDLSSITVISADGRVLAAGPKQLRAQRGGSSGGSGGVALFDGTTLRETGGTGRRPLELVFTAVPAAASAMPAGQGHEGGVARPPVKRHRLRAPSAAEHHAWMEAVVHNVRLLAEGCGV